MKQFFFVWSCSSIQWSVVTHVGTWGVSYPILFHLYINICNCFRSLFIVPGSQTMRLAHPHPFHWPHVATWKEYPIIPLTLDSGSINGWDTFLGDSRNPKAGTMEPNDQPLFWGVDLPFFGLNLPKIWVIWVWLVVEFFKHLFTLFFVAEKR